MKRNWDLLMEILQSVEGCDYSLPMLYPTRETDYWKGGEPDHDNHTPMDATPDEFLYHGKLLEQAGFVMLGNPMGGPGVNNFPRAFVNVSLTWEGHEFLDRYRTSNISETLDNEDWKSWPLEILNKVMVRLADRSTAQMVDALISSVS